LPTGSAPPCGNVNAARACSGDNVSKGGAPEAANCAMKKLSLWIKWHQFTFLSLENHKTMQFSRKGLVFPSKI
jgi:hypothetical protein